MRTFLAALCFGLTLAATGPVRAEKSGSDYVIHVLTFGPGDHPFFKFGHNAIWVHDNVEKSDKVYNWGTFYFDSPMLIPQFMKGLLRYWLSVDPFGLTVAIYKAENRTVDAQELALTDAEKLELVRIVEENAKPENMYYRYDYYMDNCSTRVRDVIDRVTKGALHAAVENLPASYTFRQQTRRLTQDDLWEYLALDIVMADFIDKPIGYWEEMFLPIKVHDGLAKVTMHRPEGDVPLVRANKTLVRAPTRPPPPDAPPRWHLWFLLAGIGLGGIAAAGGFFYRRTRWARVGLRIGLMSGGLFGLLGCIFVVFWVLTDHRVAHHNENIWQCAPFAVVLLSGRFKRALRLVLAAVGFSVIGLLAKALPMADQLNGEWICFFLAFWTLLAVGVHFAKKAGA